MRFGLNWLISILLSFAGFIIGIFACHALVYSKFDITALAQIVATISIPFVYFFLVERDRDARRIFADMVSTELHSIMKEVETSFDDVSRMHTSSNYEERIITAYVPSSLHHTLRIGNLVEIAKTRGDSRLANMIKGIGRFIGEYRGHLLEIPVQLSQNGSVSDEHFHRILNAYAHIIHNHQLTILHANGLISRGAVLIKAPDEGQIT